MAGESIGRVSRSFSAGGVTVGGVIQTVAGDMVATLSKIVPASTTNGEFDFAVDVSTVKGMAMEVSHDATVKTNSTSTPGNTLTLLAGIPVVWVAGDDADAFLTVDVTTFYVTTGGLDTAFRFVVVSDSTPVLA